MSKQEILAELKASGIVAVIRTDAPEDLMAVFRALEKGGVHFMEITLTTPGACEIIRNIATQSEGRQLFVGAGTVLDGEAAQRAIEAGARFVVSPSYDAEVVKLCNSRGVVSIPGALTPGEVIRAWKGGADVVKIFPADAMGPHYLKTVREPLPQVELLPTKGINIETAKAYLEAGAIAVGVGGELASKALIAARNYGRITENARGFSRIVRESRRTA